MTEKRFEMVIVDVQGNFYYLDRVTDEKISSTLALEGKLNELAEENEQLKQEVINLKVEIDTHKHPLWSTREAERIINELKKENEQLKKDLEILVHLVDWRDKLEKEWWRCKYFTNPLGVAFCSKNEDFCKRGECGDI